MTRYLIAPQHELRVVPARDEQVRRLRNEFAANEHVSGQQLTQRQHSECNEVIVTTVARGQRRTQRSPCMCAHLSGSQTDCSGVSHKSNRETQRRSDRHTYTHKHSMRAHKPTHSIKSHTVTSPSPRAAASSPPSGDTLTRCTIGGLKICLLSAPPARHNFVSLA